MKDSEEDTQMERYPMFMDQKNIVELSILPKAILRFNAISIKILMVFLIEIEQTILKCVWNHKGPWIDKAILRRTAKPDASHFLISSYTTKLSEFKQYGTCIKTDIDPKEQNREPERNPHIYGQLEIDKESMNTQWGKNNCFNNMAL